MILRAKACWEREQSEKERERKREREREREEERTGEQASERERETEQENCAVPAVWSSVPLTVNEFKKRVSSNKSLERGIESERMRE